MKRTLLTLLVAALAVTGIYFGLRASDDAPPTPPVQPQATTPATAAPTNGAQPVRPVEAPSATPERREAQPLPTPGSECPQGVRGTIVDGAGAPIADAQVYLQETIRNDMVARFESLTRDVAKPPTAAGTTDAQGAFALGLQQPPTHALELWVFAVGYADQRVGDLTVQPNAWIDLGRVALDRGRAIRGRVTIASPGDTGAPDSRLPAPNAVVVLDSSDPLLDLGTRPFRARSSRIANADANGDYVLPHAPNHGTWRLSATAPGFARQLRNDINLAAVGDLVIDFTLLGGLAITGRLLGSDGQAIAGAHLEAWPNAPEPAFAATTGADGRFTLIGLREGPHRLRAMADGYQTLDQANVLAGGPELVLRLDRRAAVAVVVRSPQGAVLRDYRLAVRRWFAEAGGQLGPVKDVPERRVRLEPDADAALIEGLEPAAAGNPVTYVFQVEADGFAKTLSPTFTVDPLARPRIEMTMTLGGTLRGRVLDERGAPVAGATIATQAAGAVEDNPVWRLLASLAPDRITRTTATTAADGSFTLQHLAHAGYQLAIEHPEFCRTLLRDQVVLGDAEQTLPTIALRRGAQIRGRAFVDGEPRAQVVVVLTPAVPAGDAALKTPDESALVRVEAVSDNEGNFALPRRVPPGLYELRAHLQVARSGEGDVFAQMQQMQRSALTVAVPAGRDVVEQDVRIAK